MSKLLEGLNKEQLKAVTHDKSGPLLIIAGAGTGKTTVITRRISYLIEQGLAKPDEILALTFTDKAAGEMEERVDQLVELGIHDFWISTFHSFCQRILEQHGLDIGLANTFKLLDDIQQWILIHNNFDKFNLDYYKPLGSPNRFISSLLDHFSKCKDELITPEQYLNYAEKLKLSAGSGEGLIEDDQVMEAKRIEEVANAFHVYQKLLLDNEYLDFGDLINYAIELLEKRPNILKFYQQKFKYILVDEFQDTNYAQYQLIKLLTGNHHNVIQSEAKRSEGSRDPSSQAPQDDKEQAPQDDKEQAPQDDKKATASGPQLVVVGDDDQSIYKFRGASVSNILKLKDEFKDVTEVTLTENYRSSQEILDLAYKFIQGNNPDRLETKLKIEKKLKANIKEKGEIEVLEGTDLSSELNMVIKKITELKAKDEKATWNDFAILVRANSAADEITPRLDGASIPYTFLANRGLFKKPVISQLIDYLKLLDEYHESSALYNVLNFQKFAIEPEELALISAHAKKKTLSLYETLYAIDTVPKLSEDTIKTVQLLLKQIKTHSDLKKDKTVVELFVTIIDDLGVLEELKQETEEAAENREFVDQFFKRMEQFEEQAEQKNLQNFMARLALEMEAGDTGTIKFDPNLGPESLKVMTVHSAKGLEFKYAFMVNMVDQRFPTRKKSDPIAIPDELIKDILPEGDVHLQEERRLFYVAITRAKTNLYLSWSKDYGGAKAKKPSIFLQETELVPSEKVNQATGKVVFQKPKSRGRRKQVYKRIPTHFSFSDISTFQTCPLEYKYKNYLQLPLPGAPQLSFGVTIHNVLQKYGQEYLANQELKQSDLFGDKKDSGVPPFKLMEELYQNEFIDEWYNDKQEKEKYRQLGKEILKTVYEDFSRSKPAIKFIEQKFSLKLKDYEIVGRIDRIDSNKSGGLTVVDYKTGKSKKTKNKLDVDQLKLYQWAIEEGLKDKVTAMYYWYLPDNQIQEQKIATPEELKELQNSMLETIEEIIETIKYDTFQEKHQKSKQHFCKY